MFREMRRIRQLLTQEECEEILRRNTAGTLALAGDNGYPYALPISYVYHDGKLFFHGAKTGHKIDAVRREEKASFSVIDKDQIVPEEYTTYFRSVIAFGRMRILEDDAEKRAAIEILAANYGPDDPEGRQQAIDREWNALCILEFSIEHMTGKQAIELCRKS